MQNEKQQKESTTNKDVATESSSTQQNGNDQYKETYSKDKVIKEPIDKSPFHIVGILKGEEGEEYREWFIAMGQQRMTDKYVTKEEALAAMETWEFSQTLIICTIQSIRRIEQEALQNANQKELFEGEEP